jgi:hypothetical protein
MRPKPKEKQKQQEMFEREPEGPVNPGHALVKPGRRIDWTRFEEKLGATCHAGAGAPGVNTRLMVAPHDLKFYRCQGRNASLPPLAIFQGALYITGSLKNCLFHRKGTKDTKFKPEAVFIIY